MTEGEKIKKLVQALNEINNIIYANKNGLVSTEYFKIRNICVNAIKAVGDEVQ